MDNTVLPAIHDMPGPHGRLQELLSQMVCQIDLHLLWVPDFSSHISISVCNSDFILIFIMFCIHFIMFIY